MHTHFPQIPDLISQARARLKHNWKYLFGVQFGVTLLTFAVGALIAAALVAVFKTQPAFSLPLVGLAVVAVVALVVTQVLSGCAIVYIVAHPDEKDRSKIWRITVKRAPAYFLVSLLYFLVTLGGMVFFVIPGILIAFLFGYSLYESVVHGRKGMNALKSSAQIFSQHWRQIIVAHLPLLAIYFVAGILFTIIESIAKSVGIPSFVPELIKMIGNTAIGLFAINLSYEVYLAAKSTTDVDREFGPWKPLLISALLGWVMLMLIVVLPFLLSGKSMKDSQPEVSFPQETMIPVQEL